MRETRNDYMRLPAQSQQGVPEALIKPKHGKQNVEDYFRLLRKLTAANGAERRNFVYSPVSLCCALRIVVTGARGETQKEIIRFTGKEDYALESEAVKAWNFLVYNQKRDSGALIREEYADWLKERKDDGADVFGLTEQNADELVNEMNRKCSEITNGQIRNPLDKAMLESLSGEEQLAVLLANVIHFQGIWKSRCCEIPGFCFHSDGKDSRVKAVEMKDFEEMQYFGSEDMEAVCVPYREEDGRYTFWGFLPKEKTEPGSMRFELGDLKQEHREDSLYVIIPKFQFSNKLECTQGLRQSGVKQAFERDQSDFSGGFVKTAQNRTYIHSVFQKAVVGLNEKGTEASAITMMDCCDDVSMPSIYCVYFNRPFCFMIWDEKEEAPLFVGQVFDPAQDGGMN